MQLEEVNKKEIVRDKGKKKRILTFSPTLGVSGKKIVFFFFLQHVKWKILFSHSILFLKYDFETYK